MYALASCCRVQVRAAPSMRFAYVEPCLMPMYLKFRTPQQAPSMLTPMTLKQFASRAQRDSPDAPLFYPDGEFYYMQSPVTRDMRLSGDLNFDQSPFSAVLTPGMSLLWIRFSCSHVLNLNHSGRTSTVEHCDSPFGFAFLLPLILSQPLALLASLDGGFMAFTDSQKG